jgi:hypothetical protein
VTNVDTVKDEVNAIIEIFSQPLRPEDLRAGWNEALREQWREWFIRIRKKLDANAPFKRTDVNATYGIAYAGIQEGTLFSRAARVGSMLMEMASQP